MAVDVRRRAVLRTIGLASLATLAQARAVRAMAPVKEHPLAQTIWDLSTGRRSTVQTLLVSLRAARFRLLGEVHDNPDHHAARLKLLDALGESGLKPAVAFEQFDRMHDEALQQRLTGGDVTAEDVAQAVQFDRKNWNWDLYRPLVETALRHRMPLRAANLSRAEAVRVAKEGMAALRAPQISRLGLETVWSAEKEHRLREIIYEGHCRSLPEGLIPNMTAAQRARDATLADALLDPSADGAVLIAGNGHVRRDLGVPLYLRQASPDARVVSLGLLEVESGKDRAADYMAEIAYDFAWFTPQARREDPCKALRSPQK
jgi:uncharacterized iron-regulated protein